jgi:hypothetical protein
MRLRYLEAIIAAATKGRAGRDRTVRHTGKTRLGEDPYHMMRSDLRSDALDRPEDTIPHD